MENLDITSDNSDISGGRPEEAESRDETYQNQMEVALLLSQLRSPFMRYHLNNCSLKLIVLPNTGKF